MYYFVYETRNKLNGRYYRGKHQTKDLNDGYLGSGKILELAIEKYGNDNFEREILEFFKSADEAFEAEKNIYVTKEIVEDPLCYNIKVGGDGGFAYSLTPEERSKHSKGRIWINFEGKNKFIYPEEAAEFFEQGWSKGFYIENRFLPDHTGTRWINKEGLCKKVPSEEIKFYLDEGWNLGRIFNPSEEARKKMSEASKKAWEDGKCSIPQSVLQPGQFFARNSNGEIFKIFKDDERYLSGELISANAGRKRIQRKPRVSSFIGKKFINKDGKACRVLESEVQGFLENGWKLGRGKLKKSG